MATVRMRSRVRRATRCVAVFACLALSVPSAVGRPRVSATFRHRPAAAAVAVARQGGIYTVANEGADRDSTAIVRAYSPGGTLRWERTWRPPLASVSGRDIAVAPDGTIAVAAKIASTDPDVPCDEIWSYGWAVRTWASDGTPLWQHAQRGWRTCDVFGTAGWSVAIGPDVVVLGIQHGDEYSASVDLVAFGRDGARRWLRRLRVPGADDESVGELTLGSGGAIYAAATTYVPDLDVEHEAEAVLVKCRPDGSPVWVRRVPGRPGADERGASVAVLGDGVVFGALGRPPTGPGASRVAVYGSGGDLRWRWRATGALQLSRRSWPGPWVGTWSGGVVLAGTENAGAGHTRPTLRGFGADGAFLWRVRLGPAGLSWGVHAFAASGGVVALAGGPYDPVDGANRVWVLTG